MASNKYKYPPAPPSGSGTFSDDLVGFQLVDGGGLTQSNFEFSTSIVEKVNRTFETGTFSKPLSLNDLNVESVEEAKLILAKNLSVYPNYDISEVINFSLYGSLQKRLSYSITKIINYFPGAIEVDRTYIDYSTGNTATNITYDSSDNTSTFYVDVTRIKNPFDIDYSENADRNISVRPMEVSELRNLTRNYLKYSVFFNDFDTEYKVIDFVPTLRLSAGTFEVTIEGNPFTGDTTSTASIVLKPNINETEKAFKDNFDEVEDFLLNRLVSPKYTARFNVLKENTNGKIIKSQEVVTWPIYGGWNLDIVTDKFNTYTDKLNSIAEDLDDFKTNLIVRFLTTDAFKDFDTSEQKAQKILQIYGRSFDDTKKFIDALAYINSVHYTVENDIPSELLKNLAQTLGWTTNMGLTTNDEFLSSVFNGKNTSAYDGQSRDKTPDELNYQYFRNLILNSAYLFKSKGTRRSIEYLLRMVGAPKALIEFNETIYLADGPINVNKFNNEFATISGGTKLVETPIFDSTNTFKVQGVTYTGFTTTYSLSATTATRDDYPIDSNGYPIKPEQSSDFFFEKGAGWFEKTPQHRSPEVIDETNSIFTGQNYDVQTTLETFTYGQKYFDRLRTFPSMSIGYGLTRAYDNNKTWTDTESGIRRSTDAGYDARYGTEDERLVLNAKNIELYLNMGQGLLYDVWEMSKKYNYPIPSSGFTSPYPSPPGVDWTVISPKPREKTFFEFAQTFYNNMINVRNRQTIDDGKGGGYPTLQSLYWNYLQSQETVNIPSNKYTYQKMIDFTLGLGDYWIRLVEQMIPATTLWTGGQKMENSVLQRQKYVWRRQRGCVIIPIPCIPCTYNGKPFLYDCIDQTLSCSVAIPDGGEILSSVVSSCAVSSGYTLNDCLLATLTSTWYVDVSLEDNNVVPSTATTLVQESFYTGYGITDYPTEQEWLDGLDLKLANLYREGLNYSLNAKVLTISNTSCYNDFTNKTLKVNIGINVDLICS